MDDDINDAQGHRAFHNSLLCHPHAMTSTLESLCNEKGGFDSMIISLSTAQTLLAMIDPDDGGRMQELIHELRSLPCTLADGGSTSQIKLAFQACYYFRHVTSLSIMCTHGKPLTLPLTGPQRLGKYTRQCSPGVLRMQS